LKLAQAIGLGFVVESTAAYVKIPSVTSICSPLCPRRTMLPIFKIIEVRPC
jgi:hypothetical protein